MARQGPLVRAIAHMDSRDSILRSVGADGKYLPAEQLQPVSILRVSVAHEN